ncbi:hypothetical protein H8356DRAFT_1425106 [Neocallimastix lanati (nom. inval.)]|nr:hypothetical protein H8356DRAFT_1425106 [Neocallimastix sp. JGI-2020a]
MRIYGNKEPFGSKTEKKGNKPSNNDFSFNSETGEINWNCPCLGDITKGLCAKEYKAAFSCYIYSQAYPKGMYYNIFNDEDDLDIKTTEKKF